MLLYLLGVAISGFTGLQVLGNTEEIRKLSAELELEGER